MARLTDDNRLSLCRRDVAADWDYEKNAPYTPDQFTVSSNVVMWWKCRAGLGHPSYQRKVEQRTRKQPLKCDKCPPRLPRRRERSDHDLLPTGHVTDANRLSTCRKDVAALWHYEKNAPHTPDHVSIKSRTREWWWHCGAGLGHQPYKHTVLAQTRSPAPPRCPSCPRRMRLDAKVSDANRFSMHAPEDLIKSWNETENLPLTPDMVSLGSGRLIVWDCLAKPDHPSWKASVADRVGSAAREGTGCRNCAFVRTSRAELRLKAELGLFLSVDGEPNKAHVAEGRPEEVDVADPTRKLVVEFDGAYFHNGLAALKRDTDKTARLRESGWTVVRVREHPLDLIDADLDVMVPKDAHPYLVASVVVAQLARLGLIPPQAAKSYCAAGRLQAEAVSNEWISERLGSVVSKAERDTYTAKWERMYEALVSFQKHFGTCQVPDGILVKGVDLRIWCYTQRAFHRQGKLPEDRRAQLAAIPSWHFDARIGAFWEGYERYRRALEADGPGPSAQELADARQWAKKLRERRSQLVDRGGDLPQEQLDAMANISGWCWTPRVTRFEDQLAVLHAYCADTGQLISVVKAKDVWQGHRIGSWVTNWRTSYSRLPAQQVAALEAVPGWLWSKNDAAWNAKFAALAEFGRIHGHITPSLSDESREIRQLAKWKHKNRSRLRGEVGDRARRLRALLIQYGESWE
ncbi:Helicase associated domain protein [Streptomyces sp. NPDC058246]|uniref:zinc-ribbon domain-containing protein n=1 Tax=Streptomyces sp. NPDC058246 TaxID=3346400 RepID=UPI0036E180AB